MYEIENRKMHIMKRPIFDESRVITNNICINWNNHDKNIFTFVDKKKYLQAE